MHNIQLIITIQRGFYCQQQYVYTHAGGAGVSYIHIRSQPTPTYLNCSVEGWVGGQLYVDVPYFLTLAGAILCGLSIGVGLLYVCIKSDPCCFRVLYLGDIVGHVGWIFYGSIYLREAFSMWSNDQSRCSHLIMIMSAATLGATVGNSTIHGNPCYHYSTGNSVY